MAGVTDTVFRRFIRNLGGCGLIMTEFTSADGVLRKKDQKAKRYLHFYEDEHPISAQLFGSDPNVMAEAARMVEGLGFDLVDLNLGCPAKKVVKCNGGSGLLRDLPAIGRIFEAVRAAVTIPFTVKFRAGWNDEEIVCVELARMAEDCGLAAVALHARTREMGYSGNARWEWIAAIKDAVKIPVIGNGDIRSPEDACAMVTQTGCDAVMIGRSAPSNPWIFRQIEQYCAHVGADAFVRPVEQSSTGSDAGTEVNGQPHGRPSAAPDECVRGYVREALRPSLRGRSLPDDPHIFSNADRRRAPRRRWQDEAVRQLVHPWRPGRRRAAQGDLRIKKRARDPERAWKSSSKPGCVARAPLRQAQGRLPSAKLTERFSCVIAKELVRPTNPLKDRPQPFPLFRIHHLHIRHTSLKVCPKSRTPFEVLTLWA